MKNSVNRFYTSFDFQTVETGTPLDYRTVFQRDRDRIIHSSAFRRMQAKTQVFLSGEYDFYRTRLTHSIEVAQIGRSICNYLQHHNQLLKEDFFIDPDLVEAACLAHDLGHPPFGHAGERTLNRLMRNHGGFEGNAQTLRMLTATIYSEKNHRKGMNPSRALLDAVMKYKMLYREMEHPENHFLYDEQEKYLTFIFGRQELPQELRAPERRNRFRSVECQIMDWADDTAYSLNDVVDGINAGFITEDKISRWAAENNFRNADAQLVEELLMNMEAGTVEHAFARKIGDFIRGCSLTERQNFMSAQTNRYLFGIQIDEQIQRQAKLFKKLSLELVFRSPQLHQLEYKGDYILSRLFETFEKNYLQDEPAALRILSSETDRLVRRAQREERRRLICDQVSGMTDGFAMRTYRRLFDPTFGSIVDLI